MDDFDTDSFIGEVENRRAIWDISSPSYANKGKKSKAWEDICKIFYEDFQLKNNTERNELCRILHRKWKSLRDSFTREINSQINDRKSGSRRLKRKKYMFFDQLLFLKPTIKHRKSELNLDESEQDGAENYVTAILEDPLMTAQDSNQEFCPRITSVSRKKGISKIKPVEMRQLNEISNGLSEKRHEVSNEDLYDEDRHFLLSLLKHLKQIPEENKLDCKSDFLLVLKKWRTTSQNESTSTEPSSFYQGQQQIVSTHSALQPMYTLNYPSNVTPHIPSVPQSNPSSRDAKEVTDS